MVDIKDDLRSNKGFDFLKTVGNGVKGLLKGSVAPVLTAVLPTVGCYVAGGLFGGHAGAVAMANADGAMSIDNLFMGTATQIFSGMGPWTMLPQGILAQSLMWGGAAVGVAILTPSIVNAYRNEKEFSRNFKNALREKASEKMDECLQSNARYQELKKRFDLEEKKFEKEHQQEQAIRNEERREDASGGWFKRFFKKCLPTFWKRQRTLMPPCTAWSAMCSQSTSGSSLTATATARSGRWRPSKVRA